MDKLLYRKRHKLDDVASLEAATLSFIFLWFLSSNGFLMHGKSMLPYSYRKEQVYCSKLF
jgi:hypothetical protein